MFPSVFAQCCDANHLYLFKQKRDEQVTMKVYGSMGHLIQKRQLNGVDFRCLSFPMPLGKNLKEKVIWLLEQGYTPSTDINNRFIAPFQQGTRSEAAQSTLVEKIALVVSSLQPKLIIDLGQFKSYHCPLTLEVLLVPATDDHGHTFEESAIKAYLKEKNECPVSRQPITKLNPSLVIKEAIEDLQKKAQVPQISFSIKENSRLANLQLQNGQAFEEEAASSSTKEEALKCYSYALECYSKALQYTKQVKDYEHIPAILERMKQSSAAALGYLYLAQYQWQAQANKQALQSLEKADQLYPNFSKILMLLAQAYEAFGNHDQAAKLYSTVSKLYQNDLSEEAFLFYKAQHERDPSCLETYERLIPLCPNPQTKAHYYLKGALHFLRLANRDQAQDFCKKASEIYKESPLVAHIPYLNLLKQSNQIQELEKYCLELVEIYEKSQSTKDLVWCYKTLLSLHPQENYYGKLIAAYQSLHKSEEILAWSLKWINFLIGEKNWQKAEEIALQILETTSDVGVLEQLERVYSVWQGHRLSDLWLRLGKNYEERSDLKTAATIYRKAYDQFQQSQHLSALTRVLAQQGEIAEAVALYYNAAQLALLQNTTDDFRAYVEQIHQIDPELRTLAESQRNTLTLHLRLSQQIVDLTAKISEQTNPNETISELNKKILEQTEIIQRLSQQLREAE